MARVLTLLFILVTPACLPDNVATCEAWLDTMSCGDFDFSQVNCHNYEDTVCDVSPYFDCLTEQTTCENEVVDTSGWSTCTELAQCE